MNSEHVSRACDSAIKLFLVFFRPYAATAPSPISRPALLSSDCSIQSGESGVKASQGLLGTVRFIFVGASEERHPTSETDDWTRVGYEIHYHNRRVFKEITVGGVRTRSFDIVLSTTPPPQSRRSRYIYCAEDYHANPLYCHKH